MTNEIIQDSNNISFSATSSGIDALICCPTVDMLNTIHIPQYIQRELYNALYSAIVEASCSPERFVSGREQVSESNEVSTELNDFLQSIRIISDE